MSRVLKPSAHWQINGHYANSVDASKPVSLNSGTEKYDFVDGKLCFNFDGSTDLSHAAADTDTIAYTLDGHRYACVAGTTYYKDAAPVAPYTFYADATSIGTGLTGKMRDVTHWPVELTADELAQDFAMSLTPDHLWEPALPIPQSAPMYSPVGAWGFDDGLGFKDISGNGNDGTNIGSTLLKNGEFGFNGAQTINVGNAAILRTVNAFSVSFWLYKKNSVLSDIYSNSNLGSFNARTFNCGVDANDKPFIRTYKSVTADLLTSNTGISTSKWGHIAFTYDGTIKKIYVNGVQDSNTSTVAAPLNSVSQNFFIGSTDNTTAFLTGEVSGLIHCDYALTDNQIKSIYRAGVPADREGELIRTLDGKTDLSAYGRTITRSNCVSLPDRMTFSNGGLSWSAITGIQSYGYTYIDPTTGIPSHYATDGVTTWTNGIATGAMPFAVGSTGFSGVTADIVDLWATSGSITAAQEKKRYIDTRVLL